MHIAHIRRQPARAMAPRGRDAERMGQIVRDYGDLPAMPPPLLEQRHQVRVGSPRAGEQVILRAGHRSAGQLPTPSAQRDPQAGQQLPARGTFGIWQTKDRAPPFAPCFEFQPVAPRRRRPSLCEHVLDPGQAGRAVVIGTLFVGQSSIACRISNASAPTRSANSLTGSTSRCSCLKAAISDRWLISASRIAGCAFLPPGPSTVRPSLSRAARAAIQSS